MKITKITITSIFILGLCATVSSASIKELKVYKQAFPDLKPKCVNCHVSEKPKKQDGEHDLDAYGLKLQEVAGEEDLTVEMLQSVGNHEDFQAEEVEAEDGTEVETELIIDEDSSEADESQEETL